MFLLNLKGYQCQAWWHGICADKNAMEFKGDRTFICDLCTGRAVIPPIFEETPKSSPAGTSHGREFVEHKIEGMTTPKRSQERGRSSKNTTEEDGTVYAYELIIFSYYFKY